MIAGTDPNGPAQAAGLMSYDIVALDGLPWPASTI